MQKSCKSSSCYLFVFSVFFFFNISGTKLIIPNHLYLSLIIDLFKVPFYFGKNIIVNYILSNILYISWVLFIKIFE